MKYIVTALLISASLNANGQTAVILPSAPIIPNISVISPNASSALAISTTNRIFIDQSGVNPDINLTQDGSGNKLGSESSAVYLRGIDQKLITRQIGNNNEISLALVNPLVGENQGISATLQQIGNNNKMDIRCGQGSASTGNPLLSDCKSANINWKLTGDNNELQFRGTGNNLRSAGDINGTVNKFYIDAINDNHSQTFKLSGDYNTFNIDQRSTGLSGSSVWVDLSGSGNTFNISQVGPNNHVVNILSTSNNGNFNIIQK